MGSAETQGKVGAIGTQRGMAGGEHLWQHSPTSWLDQSQTQEAAHYTILGPVLGGHSTQSALVHGLKGYFSTGDGSRCDPFTITDAHSRYLIRCQIVSRMDLSQVRAVCEAAMREYGVPARIRTDNGAPFAGTGLLGFSKLSLG